MNVSRIRLAQIRTTSALTQELTQLRPLASLVSRVRKWPFVRPAVDLVAGYNRVFTDLVTAQSYAARYRQQGHDSPATVHGLQADMATTRPSDYPVLFQLCRFTLTGQRIFDLGGTAGNLFYLYDRYLKFPADLTWTVHDLPGHMQCGRNIARERNEPRVRFSHDPQDAAGAGVLLISGALHYLPYTLTDYLDGLHPRPRAVIVNRTPFVEAPSAATVQFVNGVMVACKLLNRKELITSVERIGYRLVDAWRVPELSIKLPYDREYWVKEYGGVCFRIED